MRLLLAAHERDPEFVPAINMITLVLGYGGTIPGMTDEERQNFAAVTHIATIDGTEWWLKGWWSPRVTIE